MLSKGEIARRLFDVALRKGEGVLIEDVRIGLGYIGVVLNSGRVGVAALLLHELPAGCSAFSGAGKIAGSEISSLLPKLVDGKNSLEKALALAAANAVISASIVPDERDCLSIIDLTLQDRVAMVGLFAPMIPKIESMGAKIAVIERNPARMTLPTKKEADKILKECTVAIITATALLNDTMEEVLHGLRNPRHVVILGPSTPLCPEIFHGTLVNHLGGAVVRDAEKVLQIISEGGGTPAMRPYLGIVNLLFKSWRR